MELVFGALVLAPPALKLEIIPPCSVICPLPCTDPSLPRPSISLSPTGVTAPGADITIRCQGQRWDVRFFLHKAGDLNPQRHMDPAGNRAEFRIPTVGRQHGGSYSCSYRPRSEPFVSSYASSYVELVVAGEGPGSISPLPAGHSEGRHPDGGCSESGSAQSPRARLNRSREVGVGVWGGVQKSWVLYLPLGAEWGLVVRAGRGGVCV
uniref:Ig-like domain-containing protein n=1 Tax=Chrysemys picta bellii TaxID=8478 RepID=A0A8C3HNM5_CHRPI